MRSLRTGVKRLGVVAAIALLETIVGCSARGGEIAARGGARVAGRLPGMIEQDRGDGGGGQAAGGAVPVSAEPGAVPVVVKGETQVYRAEIVRHRMFFFAPDGDRSPMLAGVYTVQGAQQSGPEQPEREGRDELNSRRGNSGGGRGLPAGTKIFIGSNGVIERTITPPEP